VFICSVQLLSLLLLLLPPNVSQEVYLFGSFQLFQQPFHLNDTNRPSKRSKLLRTLKRKHLRSGHKQTPDLRFVCPVAGVR
jgi:hypothetical protein